MMKKWLLFSLLPISLSAATVHAGSMRGDIANQYTSPNNNRYYALAQQPRFNSVVSIIGYNGPGAAQPVNLCGGTFINAHTVVTAAHCLYDSNGAFRAPNSIQIGAGPDARNPLQTFSVFDAVVYPDYLARSINREIIGGFEASEVIGVNDLALLQVDSPIYSAPGISTIYSGAAPLGQFVSITGYGNQGTGECGKNGFTSMGSCAAVTNGSDIGIKLAGLNTVDGMINNGTALTYNFDGGAARLRQGLPSTFLEYEALQGDSGSGVFLGDQLLGLNSFGSVTGTYGVDFGQSFSGAFTFLSEYSDWIAQESFGAVNFAGVPGFTPSNPLTPTVRPDVHTKTFFGVAVDPSFPLYFDPDASDSVEFIVNSGPLISAFEIPLGFGDGLFDIYRWNPTTNSYVLAGALAGGDWFNFVGGVARFAVGGIGGPTNTLTYGLRFASAGFADFTQRDVSLSAGTVPEPATWAMMLVGFAMMGASMRYRRRSTTAAYA